MLNWIWLGLILSAVMYAAFSGRMQAVNSAVVTSAGDAVTLVIGLTGLMVFFLGLMEVARQGGLLRWISRGLRPVLIRLFPDVPPDHPAMGAMVMNFASNILGLGNAATPFGLKAMTELARLNPHPGVATNSMVLFLAINTSAITLMLPTGTIAVRAAAGSAHPGAIWIPTLIATLCSTAAAIGAFYFLKGRARYALPAATGTSSPPGNAPGNAPSGAPGADLESEPLDEEALLGASDRGPMGTGRGLLIGGFVALVLIGLIVEIGSLVVDHSASDVLKELSRDWAIPLLIAALLLVGVSGRVPVYESMVAGAREGMQVAVRILPYLVAILVAVGMFRASGLLDLLIAFLDPLTRLIGIPGEVLPMALLRPLSGSGAYAVMAEILETQGPDSFVGYMVSTLQGSTETTFYVLTLYAGAGGVRDVRHALAACLIGDLGGLLGATAACHLFFG